MTRLKNKRLAAGLKLHELADRLAIRKQTVQSQEQRGAITISTARRYAAALHCRPEDILEL